MYCLDIEIYADRWEELEEVVKSVEYNSDYLGSDVFVEIPFMGVSEMSILEDLEVAA